MYPNLHEDVLNALSEAVSPKPYFNKSGGDHDAIQVYQTSIRGKFKCSNEVCIGVGWSSNRVSILIRGYKNNGYNALVFNQECKACEHFRTLTIDKKAYVDRVRYRLLKFAGVHVEPPPYSMGVDTLPHRKELCEGCRRGYCRHSSVED
ncbi:zinc-binding domain-containing protein [Triangularia verruculosa]|uniref:Zinc-binding domain-containing protein n=1 Tax=Triangularia verruculosa TaxID=2587418 RepID=A0AAN6XIP4_9PEZI|nr:zinc-binding domain-containing protein [Triangularia verruculosa]